MRKPQTRVNAVPVQNETNQQIAEYKEYQRKCKTTISTDQRMHACTGEYRKLYVYWNRENKKEIRKSKN